MQLTVKHWTQRGVSRLTADIPQLYEEAPRIAVDRRRASAAAMRGIWLKQAYVDMTACCRTWRARWTTRCDQLRERSLRRGSDKVRRASGNGSWPTPPSGCWHAQARLGAYESQGAHDINNIAIYTTWHTSAGKMALRWWSNSTACMLTRWWHASCRSHLADALLANNCDADRA